MPEAVDAMIDRAGEVEYVRKCFGALFRGAVKFDPPWLWHVVDIAAKDLLKLAPYLGAISWSDPAVEPGFQRSAMELGWEGVPGKMGWREWIKSAETAGWIDATSVPREWRYATDAQAAVDGYEREMLP